MPHESLDAFCVSSQTELSPAGGIPREQFLISVEGRHSHCLPLLVPGTHSLCNHSASADCSGDPYILVCPTQSRWVLWYQLTSVSPPSSQRVLVCIISDMTPYSLSTCYMPGSELNTEDTVKYSPWLCQADSLARKGDPERTKLKSNVMRAV